MAYSLAVVLLSGPIASGKTTLAQNLTQLVSAEHISTSGLIAGSAGRELGRGELQALSVSASLQGADWIASAVKRTTGRSPAKRVVVVDAIRTLEQLADLRKAAQGAWRILHVYLDGDSERLANRHEACRRDEDVSWDRAMRSPSEAAVQALHAEADLVIDTTRATPTDVVARVGARLGRVRR